MSLTKGYYVFVLLVLVFLAACSQTPVPEKESALESQGLNIIVDTVIDKHDFVPGDGLCAAGLGGHSGCTLRAAIEETNASVGSDNIVVPPGLYVLSKGSLGVTDDVVIKGAGRSSTIIDANDASYVFEIDNGAAEETFRVELHYLTTRNASYTGIMNIGAELLIHKSIISDNNPTTYANSAGILNYDGATLELNRSIVTRNGDTTYTYRGAGLINDDESSVLIIKSTISHNKAQIGAGIYNEGAMTILDSTISHNEGQTGTGGILNTGALKLKNVTVAVNTGTIIDVTGIGLPTGGLENDGGLVTINNSIVAMNDSLHALPKDCTGVITSGGYNLIQDTTNCNVVGNVTGNLVGVNPLLLPLANNNGLTPTHALDPASPARNAGNPAAPNGVGTACNPSDQRNRVRGAGTAGRCDMGAFELNAAPGGVVFK